MRKQEKFPMKLNHWMRQPFVITARELSFEFYQRTQTTVSWHELDPLSGKNIDRSYKILNVLEFNSSRKRLSVIVQTERGKLLLPSKGADSVMFARLFKDGTDFEKQTREHVNDYANAVLRTLILAYRELKEEEYIGFNQNFSKARNSLSVDCETSID
ncbi:hypothetical protein Nepgr_024391 [Nepenthes gracilis]|uniref:Uncharacterized protein n=1 Tax=Nepenthes gracilis TaxID=150966 RepID=A0AAD3T2R5_NEPGR|nr:hypothetical protein Nepgr_024391 [Nepenthes gracilis]